ncbi:MAG: hypothetical protein IPF82_16870 [Blastocatellia bacterium]|nr:hypothetical protein [Blastocatellia bacterium]
MVGDARRGPTLELVIASMLSMPAPPRIALLSATIGEPERLQDWLSPCQLITSSARTPLSKEVWQLESGEAPDEILAAELSAVLEDPSNAAIVFVYQRRSAEALARKLNTSLGWTVRTYHSGKSAAERASVRSEFESGACRCVVSTTALAMGVNLPATHVLVRDTSFFGFGKLRSDELLQIVGRAGRGDRAGTGVVLVRPSDDWKAEDLAEALRSEVLPPLRSSFDRAANAGQGWKSEENGVRDLAAASLVATCVGRTGADGIDRKGLEVVLGNTLGGAALVTRVDAASVAGGLVASHRLSG